MAIAFHNYYVRKEGKMQINVGYSKNRDITAAFTEAIAAIHNPNLMIFMSSYDGLPKVAELLKEKYANVPFIGTSAITYYKNNASDQTLCIIGFGSDAEAQVGVLRNISSAPMYDLYGLKNAINKVMPGERNSICIEFCTGDEERLVTSMNVALGPKKVPLLGGTVFGVPENKASKVCVNGDIYEDACCYAVIKNKSGKIRTYSELIYRASNNNPRHIATKVNLAKKELISLDNRPAADVYANELGISKNQIIDNVLEAPLGRVVGDEVFISSMKEIGSNGSLINYKRLNENDTVTVLKLMDYDEINQETRRAIKADGSKISFVFSVNCIYRHLLFSQRNHLQDFLKDMGTLGTHVGVVGGGEQYKNQHVNQTMVCAVFE